MFKESQLNHFLILNVRLKEYIGKIDPLALFAAYDISERSSKKGNEKCHF